MARMLVEIPIPPKWKQLWDTWDLRCFIVFSLTLQTFLIFVAPFRKRTKSYLTVIPLWSAYLLADATANFAVGLISNSMGNNGEAAGGKKNRTPVENKDLLAFWAPFLLVHLGGPDTITAFALEDNELWLRHLLGLLFQCLAAVYVFVQSLPDNALWIPTALMFVTGIIKYAERTRSLYLASADRFKESMLTLADPGPNYARLMDELDSKKKARLPTSIAMSEELDTSTKSANKAKKGPLTDLEVVQYGYLFYEKFKGLVVDTIFSQKDRNLSRHFFLNRNAKDAFKVIEVELNFIYEVLFTKLPVVYGKLGFISRFFSLATVCLAIILFVLKNKTNFSEADVTITYGLLFGALVLDLTALLMLLFSDWTIIALRKSPDDEPDNSLKSVIKTRLLKVLLKLRGEAPSKVAHVKSKDVDPKGGQPRTQSKHEDAHAKNKGVGLKRCFGGPLRTENTHEEDPQSDAAAAAAKTKAIDPKPRRGQIKIMSQRWSKTINTFNLIDYCLRKHHQTWEKVSDKFGVTRFLDSLIYVKTESFSENLRDFIFDEVKSKSELADDMETAKEISSARGDWVLRVESGWGSLLKYVLAVDYDQSLIQWHIATELLYNVLDNDNDKDKDNDNEKRDVNYRDISKLLSDYMFNLLIMQDSMMSAVSGIAEIRFRDTCEEAKRFFEEKKGERSRNGDLVINHRVVCKAIYDVWTEDVEPEAIKGDQSKSLLFNGCILAKDVMKVEAESNGSKTGKWEIISKVWLELLCYAASHSRANMQAAQVSKGGELITIVWLLMSHFGLGEQFQINEGQSRAKLIVGK